MSIWKENLGSFRDALASASPTPGGGSGAMVTAAFGCGLLAMAAEVSAAAPDSALELKKITPKLHELIGRFSEHAEKDIEAYNAFAALRSMPKHTEAEIAARAARREEALRLAAQAPRAAMEDINRALELAEDLLPFTKQSIVSDVGAGTALLRGALDAASVTLTSNIVLMKDEYDAAEFGQAHDELLEQGIARAERVLEASRGRLTGSAGS